VGQHNKIGEINFGATLVYWLMGEKQFVFWISGFGGLGVCMLASGTQDRGFAPDWSHWIFSIQTKFHHNVHTGNVWPQQHNLLTLESRQV
jgi:hypothetical protein